jgi:hypothetical protein
VKQIHGVGRWEALGGPLPPRKRRRKDPCLDRLGELGWQKGNSGLRGGSAHLLSEHLRSIHWLRS